MKILPNNSSLIYSGRIDVSDPFAIVWTYPGTFVRMKFKGTQLFIHVRNKHNYWNNYLGVAEGDAQTKLLLPEEGEATIEIPLQTTQDNIHEVTIFKRQDACHELTILGFEINCNTDDECELLEASPLPPRRIEVYGDSVSAGEVSEAVDYVAKTDPEHNGEYSNSWYSYAWMTARKLNSEIHDTSQGGISLLDDTGWFAAPHYKGVESCYDKIEYHPDLGPTKPWDFSRYIPQVVVVAIGQNDNHPVDYMAEDYDSEKSENWRKHYQAFIEKLMELYPKAQIILATTILCHDKNWDRSIDEVCTRIGSSRVHHFLYTKNGSGTPGHIRIPEAEQMSDELAAYITSLGDEIWES